VVDRLASSKSKVKAATANRRSAAPSAPEVKVGYKAAGRETMAAIEQELATPSSSTADAPMIEISEAPAGRETMAAIAEELANEVRPRQNTMPYGDRISNAPGAPMPSRVPRPPQHGPSVAPALKRKPAKRDDAPELTVATEAKARELPATEGVEIFELLTFIVRGNKVGDLSTDALRRRFVEQNLLHRVPGHDLQAVERIEVTPWTAKETMVVRVWCRA
jgi:hypothetical protein